MVHALREIHRVLVPKGILVDLRPMADQWPVEVFSARESKVTGLVTDLSDGLKTDEAANQTMQEVESKGWFTRENGFFFPLHYVWDTASEMEQWVDKEWEDFISLGEETRRATRSAWALSDGDSRVRVQAKMWLARWRKLII